MNNSLEVAKNLAETNTAVETVTAETAEAMLAGKEQMPPEARRALVNLLRQGVILASQKAKLFESLCRHQQAVRVHLADIYLKLVLDEKAGIAFIANIDEGDIVSTDDSSYDPIFLIIRRTLTLYDTLLLLVLRKHYQEREVAGEQRIIIDVERIEANLTPFLTLTNSSKSDRARLQTALKKMSEKKIIALVHDGSQDRYEITPVIRYVVNAELLESLLKEYIRLAQENGLPDDR